MNSLLDGLKGATVAGTSGRERLDARSNVTLGKIELVGAKSTRRVSLDVTVDGVAGVGSEA